MEKLLEDFTKCSRFNEKGKKKFIGDLRHWSDNNLINFKFEIEKNTFVINYAELLKIAFLFLNLFLLICIMLNIDEYEILFNIITFLFMYTIQFRLIFILLRLMIPSKNIILKKKSKNTFESKILICAHYDTKNSLFKNTKGLYEKYLKRSVFNISRIFGWYFSLLDKLLIPTAAAAYTSYFFIFNPSQEAVSILSDSPEVIHMFIYNIALSLLSGSLLCAVLVYLITIPFGNKINNPGADDNTSGVVGALEIARRLDGLTLPFDVEIILFDNEERGLIGSGHYVAKNYSNIKRKSTNIINLDCIGRGKDIHIMTDKADGNSTYKLLAKFMKNSGVEFGLSNIDYSDHKPFLQLGMDAVSICRYDNNSYLWYGKFPEINWIHGSGDTIEDIDIGKINEVVDVVVKSIINKDK